MCVHNVYMKQQITEYCSEPLYHLFYFNPQQHKQRRSVRQPGSNITTVVLDRLDLYIILFSDIHNLIEIKYCYYYYYVVS